MAPIRYDLTDLHAGISLNASQGGLFITIKSIIIRLSYTNKVLPKKSDSHFYYDYIILQSHWFHICSKGLQRWWRVWKIIVRCVAWKCVSDFFSGNTLAHLLSCKFYKSWVGLTFWLFTMGRMRHCSKNFTEFFFQSTWSKQNLLMSILNYFDYFTVIIKISAKNIVLQEIFKNCLR